MRYMLSVLRHYLTGRITGQHALYALHKRPGAVASKGQTYILDPDFDMGQ